jgi:hypothetical protein
MAKSRPVYCSYCGQRIPKSAAQTPPGGVQHHTDLTNPQRSYDAHMPCKPPGISEKELLNP